MGSMADFDLHDVHRCVGVELFDRDGERIGKIEDVFIAIDTRGVTLGEFSTLSEAVRIFPEGATDDQTSPAANFIKPRPARRTSPPATSPIPKTRHGLASVMNIQPAEEILP